MFVIEVIPLLKGTVLDTLSYFSATEYAIGTFVNAPIRKKLQPAMVAAVHSVAEAKGDLRAAAFALQKLPPQTQPSAVPENVRQTAAALIKKYPTSLGSMLFQLLPPEVRAGTYQFPHISSQTQNEESAPRILTATFNDRFITYRSHIRTVLARRGSVLFVVPTSTEVKVAARLLSQGIEDRVVTFSATQTPKERKNAYLAFEDTSLAKVIITTPSHAYLDRVDLLSIIVENEASEHFVTKHRPYVDHRSALITHAKITGRSIILGDILPRPELEAWRRSDVYSTEGEETKRLAFASSFSFVEQKNRAQSETAVYSMFSKELRARVEETIAARGRVFLYGARRGISPMVVCIDCGYIFRCPDSGTPYSLMRSYSKTGEEERWFISTTSGKRLRAADTCPLCNSWRLRERGIGIQAVFDESKSLFPTVPTLLFDHQTASTPKKAQVIIDEFMNTKGVILVGTQMVLPYLRPGVDVSAVVSLDATRANPTWRADENVLRLLFQLREISHKEVLVQSRQPIDQLLTYAKSGVTEGFYTEELALREALQYPPHTTFILLSWQGSKEVVEKVETEILNRTASFTPSTYSNPLSTATKTLRHALFRLSSADPKLADLVERIRHFPPYIKIELNPSRIV